jgi:hypothetical protein
MSNRAPTLIDQLQIRQEPRGQIGRYFLAVEQGLADLGLILRIMPIIELARVHNEFASSWNGLAPVFDAQIAPIDADRSAALVAYDQEGRPAATHACRLIELTDTLQSACEDLTLFYEPASSAALRKRHRCIMTAPSAASIRGTVAYVGGFWVRPDKRGTNIGYLMQDVSRNFACSQWRFDYEVTISSAMWLNPEIQQRYGFQIYEKSVSFFIDATPLMTNGVLAASKHTAMLDRLGRSVEDLGRFGLDAVGGYQKRIAAV